MSGVSQEKTETSARNMTAVYLGDLAVTTGVGDVGTGF